MDWVPPFARVSLPSRRSADELLAALARITRPDTGEWWASETSTLIGEVSKERLAFRRSVRGRNSFLPYVQGRIVDGPAGAGIEGVMLPHPIVLVFAAVWLFVPAPLMLPYLLELVRQDAVRMGPEWIAIAVWLAMLPIALVGYVPEALKMRRILADITEGAGSDARRLGRS
jgi:hypothetical protein